MKIPNNEHKNACNASLVHDISFQICKKAICIMEEHKDVSKILPKPRIISK